MWGNYWKIYQAFNQRQKIRIKTVWISLIWLPLSTSSREVALDGEILHSSKEYFSPLLKKGVTILLKRLDNGLTSLFKELYFIWVPQYFYNLYPYRKRSLHSLTKIKSNPNLTTLVGPLAILEQANWPSKGRPACTKSLT